MDTIVIEGRVMYPDVINPSRFKEERTGADQWLIRVMIPKDDKSQMLRLVNAIQINERAQAQYPNDLDFNTKAEVSGIVKEDGIWRNQPIRDGNSDRYPNEANDHWVIHAKATADNKPAVVDGQMNKVVDATKIYSGCVCKVGIGVKVYNARGNRGIGWFLNGVQFIKNDEKIVLGNQLAIDDLFSKVAGSEAATSVGASPFTQEPAANPQPAAGSFLD